MCVYLACSLLEPFEGSVSQVQVKAGVKLEGWDFLADLGEFEEAFSDHTTRIIHQKHVDLLSETGKLTNVPLPVQLQKALDGRRASVGQQKSPPLVFHPSRLTTYRKD